MEILFLFTVDFYYHLLFDNGEGVEKSQRLVTLDFPLASIGHFLRNIRLRAFATFPSTVHICVRKFDAFLFT